MKSLLLATVASAALALPAFAQTQPNPPTPPTQSAPAAQTTQAQSGMQDGTQAIDPKTLNRQQVEDVQRALDKMSFGAGRIDGVWGPETEAALQKFQKAKDLSATSNGQIDAETITALQIDPNRFGMAGGANNANGPAQANGSNNNGGNNPMPPSKTP